MRYIALLTSKAGLFEVALTVMFPASTFASGANQLATVTNTTKMALFLATSPDLEKQMGELVYVSAKMPEGDNVDLIVAVGTCVAHHLSCWNWSTGAG